MFLVVPNGHTRRKVNNHRENKITIVILCKLEIIHHTISSKHKTSLRDSQMKRNVTLRGNTTQTGYDIKSHTLTHCTSVHHI